MCVITGAVPLVSAAFGMGAGMIVEHVRCNGTERRLSECTIRDSIDGQCSHSEDAGVRCCKLIKPAIYVKEDNTKQSHKMQACNLL